MTFEQKTWVQDLQWESCAYVDDLQYYQYSGKRGCLYIYDKGTFFFLSRVIHPAIVYPNNPNANTIINQISLKAEILLDKKNANFTELLENHGSHLLIHFIKK